MVGQYIFLASGCVAVGVVLTFVVISASVRFDISIEENLWVLAIPAVFSLVLNVSLLELYRKYHKTKD